ncbi:alpha/beta fold hydrolase [Virgibacillus sp. AGTR]|uniref:alpha/beta fold hydrolase n=1 Tax=Virgibacillus sp. AGTR TaxID=2812055 RepID=UPI001D1653A3|nr:alpha/beta hydrolase [Virgibacillus sp. AGTR]MCC2252247.1 alpha/beta fold hydrolase [Virgibacillus sp. AGTR]
MKEFKITIDNHTFYGYECGNQSAPSLICLHGMTGDSNSFGGLAEYLKDDFHLIFLDSPGHGKTPPLEHEEDYIFSSLVKRMILIDGGYVFPEHVEGLTKEKALSAWEEYEEYIDTAVYSSWKDVVDTYQAYTTKKWNNHLDHIIISNFDKVDGKFKLKADTFSLLSTIKAFYIEPSSSTYESIKCPTLFFHATVPIEDDSRTEGIKKIKKGIERVKVVGINNTKHNLHWDSPKKVSDEIIGWMSSLKTTYLS